MLILILNSLSISKINFKGLGCIGSGNEQIKSIVFACALRRRDLKKSNTNPIVSTFKRIQWAVLVSFLWVVQLAPLVCMRFLFLCICVARRHLTISKAPVQTVVPPRNFLINIQQIQKREALL